MPNRYDTPEGGREELKLPRDTGEMGRRASMDLMEQALTVHVQDKVEEYIKGLVMPKIEEEIKELAASAVAKWAIKPNIQRVAGPYGDSVDIQINFVENVIKTVTTENPITITVNTKG